MIARDYSIDRAWQCFEAGYDEPKLLKSFLMKFQLLRMKKGWATLQIPSTATLMTINTRKSQLSWEKRIILQLKVGKNRKFPSWKQKTQEKHFLFLIEESLRCCASLLFENFLKTFFSKWTSRWKWWCWVPPAAYDLGRSFFSLYKAKSETLATLTTWNNQWEQVSFVEFR